MESIMGFGYHLQTMTRDIGEPINALSGAGNLAAVKAELDKLAQKDERVSEVLPHVDALDGYFREIINVMGAEAMRLVRRQQFGAELLNAEEIAVLEHAASRVRTTMTALDAMAHGKVLQHWFKDSGLRYDY